MNLQPEIKTISQKLLIGKSMKMSFADNKTGLLWRDFMMNRNAIPNRVDNDLVSLQVFAKDHFSNFEPRKEFSKWALAEVKNHDLIPEGFEAFVLQAGLYAVFHYRGSNTDTRIFDYIYGTWIPDSGYEMDSRPQFEILGAKYKNADPESEEDIYIPIQKKDN